MNGHSNDHSNGFSNGHATHYQAPRVSKMSFYNSFNIQLIVDSPHVKTEEGSLISTYSYRKNHLEKTASGIKVSPKEHKYTFKTQLQPKKTGVLLVGMGGNNGSTSIGAIIANKKNMSWRTKDGVQTANYFG